MKLWEFPARRAVAYVAWSVAGAIVTAIVAFPWLGPHYGLVAFGVTLAGFVLLVSTGELGQWAHHHHAPRPRRWAALVGAAAVAAWGAYVLLVVLPIANFSSLPSTSNGRGILFLIAFMPLLFFWSACVLGGVLLLRRRGAASKAGAPSGVAR